MFELLGQRLWAVAPTAVERIYLETRHPSAGAGLFGRQSEQARASYDVISGVAVINVRGVLAKRGGWWAQGYEQIREDIQAALADGSVRCILLNVDSPGGGADGVKVLADWIYSVRGAKPMCAYADGTMMSAAYWIGAATGRIYAPKTAEVGSVGVVMQHLDWSKYNDKLGVNVTYVHAGKWKVVGNPDNPLSEEDQACLQEQCATLYAMFTEDVARGMGLDASGADQWADGKTFFAEKAQQLGLVSGIVAGREELIERLTQESSPMTRKELEAQHPELLAQIETEARDAAQEQGRKQAMAEAATLIRTVAGDEAADRFQALTEAGVSAKQMEALAPLFAASAQKPEGEGGDDSESRKKILQALQDSGPSPVHATRQPQPETPDMKRAASAERMKNLERR
ncbi:MAG: S49 family peptidase [Proteobacteria bacterium]|nr:S49 family peptidase [Pseudomonadota bacterium]